MPRFRRDEILTRRSPRAALLLRQKELKLPLFGAMGGAANHAKRHASILRFHPALLAKSAMAKRAWTDIAHDMGYYDQMHMVHDFRRFSGENPTQFFARFQAMTTPWA